MKKYLNEREVSSLTGRAVKTLRNDRYHRCGLPYCKIRKQVIYDVDDVVAFVERNKIRTH